MKKTKWELIGFCGVDSGLISIVDPCYAMAKKDREIEPLQITYNDLLDKLDYNVAPTKQEVVFANPAGNGVVVSSGLGDGVYPVYAKTVEVEGWGKRIKEVKIVFIEEEE